MMRARLVLVFLGSCLGIAAAAVQACGDTEPGAPADAGLDALEAGREGGSPDTGAACDTEADYLGKIPDASIADGGSTSGVCLGCAKTACSSAVDACQASCACQGLVRDALACFLKSNDPTVCAAPFILGNIDSNTRNIGISLFTCLNANCKEDCAIDGFSPPGDGDAGDGGD